MSFSGFRKLKLGVTGGIGSGKTSVCKVFNVLGISVFSADKEAHIIMDNDPVVIDKLKKLVGDNLYSEGILNRTEMAKLIFNDDKLLNIVNSIVHPVVFENFFKWEQKQLSPYVILEAAILFESGASELVDKKATVIAPVSERIDRVIKRNRLTYDQVMARIKNQMDDNSRIRLSDYIIRNSEQDMIIPEILRIHNDMLTLAKDTQK
jgi:dephospho-CoA kinase